MLLLTAAPFAQSSQPTASPAVDDASETVQRGLVAACANLREAFKAAESHITSLEKEIDAHKKVNVALTEKIQILERTVQARTEEADAWRRALEAQKAAVDKLTELAAKQDERIAKLEKSRSRRTKAGMILTGAAFIAGLILK
jgi:predicted RNase H-like nuclease (RuvC/YqgF family)